MRKRINIILLLICMSISMSACGNKQEKVQKDSNQIVREDKKEENSGKKKKLKEILEKGEKDAETTDFQGFFTAFQNLSVFDTPEAFFTNTEEMEKFFYNTALIENTKYENVEQGFLEQGRLSREKSEEVFQIIRKIAQESQKLTEDVYLGKHVYEDSDKKFLEKYNAFSEQLDEWTVQINNYNSGYYGVGEETLQLGEAERGTYVVSTYTKLESLDTGLKWNQVEWVDYDNLVIPELNDSDMIYADYYEKTRKIVSSPYGNNGRDSQGFEIMPELRVGYDTKQDDTLINGSPRMILEIGDMWNNVDIADWLNYFNSEEELANYYLDAMVKCMQIFYSDFGITDEMRDIISNVIEESFHSQSSTEGYNFVSSNNKYVIKVHAGQILFESGSE